LSALSLSRDFSEVLETKVPGHPYHDVADKLEQKLRTHPKVVWQKIAAERECYADDNIEDLVQPQRQAIYRVIQKFEKQKQLGKMMRVSSC
jgi:hypothetical protein